MSFTDEFNACMDSNGLPRPADVADFVEHTLDFLHLLHAAWEAAGGEVEAAEMTLGGLAAAVGALTGIDEGVVAFLGALTAEAAAVTVVAYLSVCCGCVVSAAVSGGMSWPDLFAKTDDSLLQNQLTVAANDQGIDTSGTAVA